jgi:CBS domain-containing protein
LHDVFYVVASGLVNLTVIVDAEKYFEQMSWRCHFGLRPFFAKNNYTMTESAWREVFYMPFPILFLDLFWLTIPMCLIFWWRILLLTWNSKTKKLHNNQISDSVFYTGQTSEMQYFKTLSL